MRIKCVNGKIKIFLIGHCGHWAWLGFCRYALFRCGVFVPAAFICGAIAFRQGDRKFGGIAIVLAIIGVIGIIAVSNQIGTARRDLERSLDSLR